MFSNVSGHTLHRAFQDKVDWQKKLISFVKQKTDYIAGEVTFFSPFFQIKLYYFKPYIGQTWNFKQLYIVYIVAIVTIYNYTQRYIVKSFDCSMF